MPTEMTPAMRRAGRLAPLIRGQLARPSGSDDDPFARVILSWRDADGGAPEEFRAEDPLRLPVVESSVPEEALRHQIRELVGAYASSRGQRPRLVLLPAVGSFRVEEDAPASSGLLANKVAVVTGAAGAIGAGICRALLEKGCRVAATDVSADSLQALTSELDRLAPGRVAGVPMDVTDKESVEMGFESAARRWGGVDIVIVNAGVAMVSPLVDLDLDAFRRLERVNVEGALLTIAEAGRGLTRQATGGDIVVISTKNVFAPGAQFGAYSATKAACHQLARIASLELAPAGIRVNMVAPDAVFSDGARKSGLWAEIGPSRMKARGLDEKGLEEYYRSRNLLKARVTAAHVANAVLFFVTRQTPTTGATIPVDGGLPDATPR